MSWTGLSGNPLPGTVFAPRQADTNRSRSEPSEIAMTKKIVIIGIGLVLLAVFGLYGAAEGRTINPQPIAPTAAGPHLKSQLPFASGTQGSEVELLYDSGPEFYVPDLDVVNAEWAVRFTPPQACSLVFLQLVTYEPAGNLAISVYADDNGMPGALIDGPYQFNAAGDLSYQQATFPVPIDVGANDFHIAVGIMESPTPHPTFDSDGGTLRTSYRPDEGAWTGVTDLDLVMSAFVRTYGADATPPEILHIPVSVAFSASGPVPIVARITDQSGIKNAIVHYTTDGVNYQSAALTVAGGFYKGAIPAFASGSNVRYYLTAQDNAPAFNAAAFPASGALAPFAYAVQPGEELSHDDGIPEEFWIESDIYDGNAFATEFWPASYPAVISHMRVLVDDTASFVMTIQANVTGTPGAVIAGPYVVSADPFSGWTDVYIPANERPSLNFGGFFVVCYWFPETPDLPGIAADASSSSNDSWWYDNAYGWNKYPDAHWIMRAAVQTPTAVGDDETEIGGVPSQWRLGQNSPNPFNPSTSIEFALPHYATANIFIHNVLGQEIREFDLGLLDPGSHTVNWDGRDRSGRPVNSGVYFYTLRTEAFTQTRKMLLLK
jgi:hypothetical protein